MEKSSGDEAPDWVQALGVAVVGSLLACIGLIAAGGWKWFAGMLESALPAWVQAVGSVAAIAATGWAVNRSHRLQREAREAEEADLVTFGMEALFQVVGSVRQVTDKLRALIVDGGLGPEDRLTVIAELEAVVAAFAKLDMSRLPGHTFIEAMIVAEALARRLIAECAQMRLPLSSIDRERIVELLQWKVATLDPRGKLLHDMIEARGGPPGRESLAAWTIEEGRE